MFTHLSIDWGSKVCGIAVGDPTTGLILPSQQEFLTSKIFDLLKNELEKRPSLVSVVIGIPTNFSGQPTEVTKQVEEFATKIEGVFPSITIAKVNERSTTIDAIAKLDKNPKKYLKDNQSAAEILDIYFSKYLRL
jgi:putative transcription antitermination factor YqgF